MIPTFRTRLPWLFLLAVVLAGCSHEKAREGAFCGEGEPPAAPAMFAPGFIDGGPRTRDVTMTPDGHALYYTVIIGSGTSTILGTHIEKGRWTEPEVASFSGDPRFSDLEAQIAPDGKRLYFVSDRPDTSRGATEGNADIWVCERNGEDWSAPVDLGAPINTEVPEFFPSVTREGVLYFTRRDPDRRREIILRARPLPGGGFATPEELGPEVNCGLTQFNAFVAPDESYLIVCVAGRTENLGQVDYFIAFRDDDDTWHGPVDLGDRINGPGKEGWSPYVSPDGRAFFFMSTRRQPAPENLAPLTRAGLRNLHDAPGNGNGDIWWMDASFLAALRDEADQPPPPIE